MRNAYRNYVGNLKRRDHFGKMNIDGSITVH
jgi:hypothetical protein